MTMRTRFQTLLPLILILILLLSGLPAWAQQGPVLLSPAPGARLTVPYPVFSWQPVSGLGRYSLLVVERLSGQSALAALQANPPYFYEEDIEQTTFTYPLTARPLRPGQGYAWQVSFEGRALDGLAAFRTASEPWGFERPRLKGDGAETLSEREPEPEFKGPYPHLHKSAPREECLLPAGAGWLPFQYEERYLRSAPSSSLDVRVFDCNERSYTSAHGALEPSTLRLGDNRLHLDVSGLAPGPYRLEVRGLTGEKLHLRFRIED